MKKILTRILIIICIIALVFIVIFVGLKLNSKNTGTNLNNTVVSEEDNNEVFNGHSITEWERFALDFYEKENNYRPSLVGSNFDENGNLVIQLYDNLGDHNSTSDYYFIDKNSGIATNILGKKIDLINGKYM